jgi:hypothetical protein
MRFDPDAVMEMEEQSANALPQTLPKKEESPRGIELEREI